MSGVRKTIAGAAPLARSHLPTEPLLSVEETAAILRLSTRHLRRLIARRELPVVRIGRAVRVQPADLRALLQSNGQKRTADDSN